MVQLFTIKITVLLLFIGGAVSQQFPSNFDDDFAEFPSNNKPTEKQLRHQQLLASFAKFYNDPNTQPGEPHPNYTDVDTSTPCDPGEPLYLTPYIDSNRAAEGRAAALVNLPDAAATTNPDIRSYAGFLTINASDFGNIFFWFWETANQSVAKPEDRPLVIWLQGGPGASSLYGLFTLQGPFGVDKDGALYRRTPYSWIETVNLLYIDQPVGTGFSFTSSDDGYAKSQVQVGWNLYTFMTQFYRLFPNFLKTDLYIMGESYAGKYVPTFAYRVHERNLNSGGVKIPLAGIAIGNGLTDPENMIEGLGPLMYNLGMATTVEQEHINAETKATKKLIQDGKLLQARARFSALLTGGNESYFSKVTGSTNYYNILLSAPPPEEVYYEPYMTRCDVRRAMHVGNVSYGGVLTTALVKHFLNADFLDTVRQWVPPLIDNYRVMFYNGQLDIIVGVPITERFLAALDGWSWKDEYLNANRTIWKVSESDKDVAGYVKQVREKFFQVVIRGAGHMVPHDQPLRGFNMVQRFVERQSFGNVTAARYHFDADGAWLRNL